MSDVALRKAGRPKGSKNKHSTALMRQAVRNSGQTPLEYLMSVYQDAKQEIERFSPPTVVPFGI